MRACVRAVKLLGPEHESVSEYRANLLSQQEQAREALPLAEQLAAKLRYVQQLEQRNEKAVAAEEKLRAEAEEAKAAWQKAVVRCEEVKKLQAKADSEKRALAENVRQAQTRNDKGGKKGDGGQPEGEKPLEAVLGAAFKHPALPPELRAGMRNLVAEYDQWLRARAQQQPGVGSQSQGTTPEVQAAPTETMVSDATGRQLAIGPARAKGAEPHPEERECKRRATGSREGEAEEMSEVEDED